MFHIYRRLGTKNVKAKVISDSFSFSCKLDFFLALLYAGPACVGKRCRNEVNRVVD